MTDATISAFDKARTGLWTSLQKHLTAVYGAEKTFLTATAFVEAFPFALHTATEEQQAGYTSASAVPCWCTNPALLAST